MALIASLELLEKTQTLDAYGHARLRVALAAAWEIKEKVGQLGRITRFELAAGGPQSAVNARSRKVQPILAEAKPSRRPPRVASDSAPIAQSPRRRSEAEGSSHP